MGEKKSTLLGQIDSISASLDKAVEQAVLLHLQHVKDVAAAHRRGWDDAITAVRKVVGGQTPCGSGCDCDDLAGGLFYKGPEKKR